MKTFILSALLIAILALAHRSFAQVAPVHQLILTETSSTPTSPTSPGLDATYDGLTTGVAVNFISPDHWGVTVSNTTFTGAPQWTEPEDPLAFNVITLLQIPGQFIVNSDFLDNGSAPLTNGATFFNFGTDTRDGGSISVTFRDRGDAAAVPDSGSAFALLFLSVTVLFGAARLKSPALAS